MTGSARRPWMTLLAATLAVAAAATGIAAAQQGAPAVLMRTVEGIAARVETRVQETGPDLIVVTLALDAGVRDETATLDLLIGPPQALADLGFEVKEGDRLRARVFEPEPGQAAPVHKIRNLDRGQMVRLRSLYRDPLWDGTGRWQGPGGRGHGAGPGPRGGGSRQGGR